MLRLVSSAVQIPMTKPILSKESTLTVIVTGTDSDAMNVTIAQKHNGKSKFISLKIKDVDDLVEFFAECTAALEAGAFADVKHLNATVLQKVN